MTGASLTRCGGALARKEDGYDIWGRKEVAIPISAVTGVEDGIRLNITRQQVQDLPPADIDHPDG